MTKVRTSEAWPDHPVWEKLGAGAYMLHDCALAYSNAHLADGLVSKTRAASLAPMVKARARLIVGLVAEGIWAEHDADTWRVCEVWDDMRRSDGRGDEQPSRAYVEGERTRARERKERWRERVTERVPTSGRNRAQAMPSQTSPVQDPEGSSPGPGPAALRAVPASPETAAAMKAKIAADLAARRAGIG